MKTTIHAMLLIMVACSAQARMPRKWFVDVVQNLVPGTDLGQTSTRMLWKNEWYCKAKLDSKCKFDPFKPVKVMYGRGGSRNLAYNAVLLARRQQGLAFFVKCTTVLLTKTVGYGGQNDLGKIACAQWRRPSEPIYKADAKFLG